MNSWIIIPARGGSKTIPKKNLAPLAGRPLIDYVLGAAMAWGKADRIIVSTDDETIAIRSKLHDAIVAGRPKHLCGDDVPVAAVIEDLLNQDKDWPDIVILLQPTSPFVLPEHIQGVIGAFSSCVDNPYRMNSFETIAICPHNSHEYNQRTLLDGLYVYRSDFDIRKKFYNKQRKPLRYTFGNLVAFRPEKFMESDDLFIDPTIGELIDRPYAHDVDDQFDLMMAEAMIEKGIVKMEHMK